LLKIILVTKKFCTWLFAIFFLKLFVIGFWLEYLSPSFVNDYQRLAIR
jgi:hypothetical protein